jgi:hypothetical protein
MHDRQSCLWDKEPHINQHNKPIETGRWQKITRENRKCTKCSKDVIGDEYHYLFICNNTEIQRIRSKYIPKYYVQNSCVAKMAGIFSLCNSQLLKSVALA